MEGGTETVATVSNAAEHKANEVVEEKQQLEELVVPTPRIPRVTNTRALSKQAQTYELHKFKKNALVIFKQTHIDGSDNKFCHKRDEDVLKQTFAQFNFEPIVREDRTKAEIMEELQKFCGENYTDYGCLAVVVLTVGSNDGLIKAKDQPYSEFEIINHFNVNTNATLITKPKFLLIQAYRDIEHDLGSTVVDIDNEMESYTLPMESDILIVHSFHIEKQAIARRQGTWFIQNLCRKIEQLSMEKDLECILDELKFDIEGLQEHDSHLRMPVTMSTLIRQLHLKKFGDEPALAVAISSVDLAAASNSDMDNDVDMEAAEEIAPCACFLEHFDYMKTCLSHYIEENPEDEEARQLIDEATCLGEGEAFNKKKEMMLTVITSYLKEKTSDCEYARCIHFYMEHMCDDTDDENN